VSKKVDTLPYGNAARSKITDFRTALYPRQYHPSTLEKPLIQRFFAYKVFFRRTGMGKTKNAALPPQKNFRTTDTGRYFPLPAIQI